MNEQRKLSDTYPSRLRDKQYNELREEAIALEGHAVRLEAQVALYKKSGCDLVVCNEPQRCGTVQELETQAAKHLRAYTDETCTSAMLRTNLRFAESRLRAAQDLVNNHKTRIPKVYANNLRFEPQGLMPVRECVFALEEIEKALGCSESCTEADAGENRKE